MIAKRLTAETIVINTGAVSNVLPIPGLTTTKHVYDSTGIQTLEALPKRLGVLGGGNIGLEFAGLYNRLGSQVTVLDAATSFLPRVEPSIAKLAKEYMEEDGIVFEQGVKTSEVKMTVMKLSLLLTKVSSVLMHSSMRQDASLISNLFTWKILILP